MTESTIEKNMEIEKQEEAEVIEEPVRRRTFRPSVDIFEANHSVVLVAEMPGVD